MSVALHVFLRALVFCDDETVVEIFFDCFPLLKAAGLDDRGNEGSFERTTTNYEGGLTHTHSSSMCITTANVDAG